MREDLLEILCCPLCRKELVLAVNKKEKTEIVEGTLTCSGCGTAYPIDDGIPNLLPPNERG